MPTDIPISPTFNLRWFYPTPGRLLFLLLPLEGIFLLLNWFQWMPKGWAVLIAIAAVALTIVVMLIWFFLAYCFCWHFQFSLRSLLLLTIVVAIPFSWLAVERKRAKEQQAVINLASRVNYVWGRVYGKSPSGPAWARQFLGEYFFTEIVCLSAKTRFKDAEMERIRGMDDLRCLDVNSAEFTDAGWEGSER